jgi:large conductance mechanosensitive channel
MISEFKKFIMKGNVIDLATAVIIGGAFGKVVSSFVNDVIMPPIGLAMGGVNFVDLQYVLKAATEEVEAVSINYGAFLQTIIDLLIIGFVIFMVIKAYESTQKKEEAAAAKTPRHETLLEEIRDLMKRKK